MNSTKLVLIALALCLCVSFPVSALWHNGNWVSENVTEGYTVIHDMQTGVDSKYKPTPQLVEGRSVGDSMQGTLRGSVRAGYNLLTREVGLRNDANPDGINGTFTFYPIYPDGTFEISLIPGNFTLMLKDGNGGQPEYSHARIVAGGLSYPERDLVGHAISSVAFVEPPEPTCPIATGGKWSSKHPFRALFTLESTVDPMWVKVETTVTGEKCTKWGWFFKCKEWTPTTETQTQWHLSQWSSHFNIITDVFRSPVGVTATTIGCKPVTPCEHPEHIELDTTPQ